MNIHNMRYLYNDSQLVNTNIKHKMYLYDNFYKDTIEIIKLFENNPNNCKNPIVNDFKILFEHILDTPIINISSNIIKVSNDHIIQHSTCEWIAVVFLNPYISIDNGFVFLQEDYNSNNKIKDDIQYDIPFSKQLITEDFFYCKHNRIIFFNSNYYHKLIVKQTMLIEIIHIKI